MASWVGVRRRVLDPEAVVGAGGDRTPCTSATSARPSSGERCAAPWRHERARPGHPDRAAARGWWCCGPLGGARREDRPVVVGSGPTPRITAVGWTRDRRRRRPRSAGAPRRTVRTDVAHARPRFGPATRRASVRANGRRVTRATTARGAAHREEPGQQRRGRRRVSSRRHRPPRHRVVLDTSVSRAGRTARSGRSRQDGPAAGTGDCPTSRRRRPPRSRRSLRPARCQVGRVRSAPGGIGSWCEPSGSPGTTRRWSATSPGTVSAQSIP